MSHDFALEPSVITVPIPPVKALAVVTCPMDYAAYLYAMLELQSHDREWNLNTSYRIADGLGIFGIDLVGNLASAQFGVDILSYPRAKEVARFYV